MASATLERTRNDLQQLLCTKKVHQLAQAQVAWGSPGGSLRESPGTIAATWLQRTSSWVQWWQLRWPPTSVASLWAGPDMEFMGVHGRKYLGMAIWCNMSLSRNVPQTMQKCDIPTYKLQKPKLRDFFRFNGSNHGESTTSRRENPIGSHWVVLAKFAGTGMHM